MQDIEKINNKVIILELDEQKNEIVFYSNLENLPSSHLILSAIKTEQLFKEIIYDNAKILFQYYQEHIRRKEKD